MRILGRIILTLIVLAIIAGLLMLYLNQKNGFQTPLEDIWEDIKNLGTQTEKTVDDVLGNIKSGTVRDLIAPSPAPETPAE